MSHLSDLRGKYKTFDADFEARKRIEKEAQSADLLAQIDREVWAMSDAGMGIAAIGRAYGTKDYGTIKRILDKRGIQEVNTVNTDAKITEIEYGIRRIVIGTDWIDVDVDGMIVDFHDPKNIVRGRFWNGEWDD